MGGGFDYSVNLHVDVSRVVHDIYVSEILVNGMKEFITVFVIRVEAIEQNCPLRAVVYNLGVDRQIILLSIQESPERV